MIIQNFNSNKFNVSRFNDTQDGDVQNIIECYFDNELPIYLYSSSDDGALYSTSINLYPLVLDASSSKIVSSTFSNYYNLNLDATSSKQVDCFFDTELTYSLDATSRLPVYSYFDNDYPLTLDATTGQVNIYQIDYDKDELIISNSGAVTFNGTTVNQEDSLGGYPCFNRINSLTTYRPNANISNMNIIFVSGSNEEGELIIETEDTEEGFFIKYMDSDSTSFGSLYPVSYDTPLKIHAFDTDKYIIVELSEELEISNRETISVRRTFNNAISMSNFDLTGSTTQYRGIFIKNQHNENIKNVKIWFDNGDSKITSEYGLEYPINKEIQVIPNIYTEPVDITWLSYDSTSAVPLFDLNVADFIGVWLKNTYDSTSVSPLETVEMYVSYDKGSDNITKRLTGHSRGFNTYFDDKYMVYFNVNAPIDASGTTSTMITESDLSGGYSIFDSTSISSLVDDDLIYYDITKLNRYGLEGFKTLNKYFVYDSTSILTTKPFGPESGSVIYNNSGSILVQALYNPAKEEIKGVVDDIRALQWNFSSYITDSSALVQNQITEMNYDTGTETEVFIKIVDDSGLLDRTPLTFLIKSMRNASESETTLTLTGEVCKQVANVPVVNTLIGRNYGLDRKNIEAYSESLTLDSTSIVMNWSDGRVSLYKDDEMVFKFFYRGFNSQFNKFYIPEGWSLLENQSVVATSTVTDHFTTYEYDEGDDILYLLINKRRFMKIDFINKEISIKGSFNDSATLPEIYSNESIFPRYDSTVIQIWDIYSQVLIPFLIIENTNDVQCLGSLETGFEQIEIEAIV